MLTLLRVDIKFHHFLPHHQHISISSSFDAVAFKVLNQPNSLNGRKRSARKSLQEIYRDRRGKILFHLNFASRVKKKRHIGKYEWCNALDNNLIITLIDKNWH
jgi:hypothetical protein